MQENIGRFRCRMLILRRERQLEFQKQSKVAQSPNNLNPWRLLQTK